MIFFLLGLLRPAAGAGADCARPLTADQAYARLTPDLSAAHDRAVVTLIARTLDPTLRTIHDRVARLDARAIRDVSATISIESSTHRPRPEVEPIAAALGYDRAYAGFGRATGALTVAFTPHNRGIMLRLLRATATLRHLTLEWHEDLIADATWWGGAGVLRRHSASRDNLVEMLSLSNDSVLQAAAQLTAAPIAGLDAAAILRAIFAREKAHPSLLNAFALALPPGLLGPNGDFYFVKDPLVMSGGRLRFGDAFRHFLKTGRERFRARWPEAWETGRGCPVAHALEPTASTALDEYLSALLMIYDALDANA